MTGPHIDERLFTSYLDGELEPVHARRVREHLKTCEECRSMAEHITMEQTEDVLEAYRSAVRGSLPSPPRPWANLEGQFHDLDAERLQTRPRPHRHLWWAAAAAGVAVAFLTVRLSTNQTVSAAELLEKASAVEKPPIRLQVRTRDGVFLRTARDTGGRAEIAAKFREARFDWDDPLRARAFADWRNGLAEKRDDVSILQNPKPRSGRFYRIKTSTPRGALKEVTIMIRAEDLRAVEQRFEFRDDDWVEISEAPAELESPHSSMAQRPAGKTSTAPSLSEELQVWAALHSIGADLGEPIDVRRTDERIEVSVLGVSTRREREIHEAFKSHPNVVLRFNQPQAVRPSGAAEATAESRAGSLQPRLLSLMGSPSHVEAFINAALEQSEIALARAHAFRQIAGRFPDRDQLSAADRDTLGAIESDHQAQLKEAARRLATVLQPLIGAVDVRQGKPVDVLAGAQRLDTLLNVALASAGKAADPEKTVAEIRQAMADLEKALAQ